MALTNPLSLRFLSVHIPESVKSVGTAILVRSDSRPRDTSNLSTHPLFKRLSVTNVLVLDGDLERLLWSYSRLTKTVRYPKSYLPHYSIKSRSWNGRSPSLISDS